MVRDPGLFFWYQAGLTQSIGARRDGAIILLTPEGVPAVGWIFRGGLAAGWKGPELQGAATARGRRVDRDRPRGAAAGPADAPEGRLMITIEHLEVLFDAERQRDEAVFARAVRPAHRTPRRPSASAPPTPTRAQAAERSVAEARSAGEPADQLPGPRVRRGGASDRRAGREQGATIPLHFNPRSTSVKKENTFAEIPIPGLESPPLQYVRGGAGC